MEDDLKNRRRPQKWKTTSKMEEDLKNGRRPQKWKTTSKIKEDLKNRRRPQKWKTTSKWMMTSKMEDEIFYLQGSPCPCRFRFRVVREKIVVLHLF